jgi:hypothetical protein
MNAVNEPIAGARRRHSERSEESLFFFFDVSANS